MLAVGGGGGARTLSVHQNLPLLLLGPPDVKDLVVVLEVAKMASASMVKLGGPNDTHQAPEVEDGDDIVGGDRRRGVSNSFHNVEV